MLNEEIKVLDHGFVRLDGVEASDLSVVNSARVSFGKRHEEMEAGDDKLINFLLKNKHGTPFEHNMFRFHVKAPLAVFREWQRHRISSFNELSGRYVKFENPDFYVPGTFRQRVEGSKPGAYQFEKWRGNQTRAKNLMLRHYQDSIELYNHYVEQGVATEQARLVLPVALYSEMYYTTNARSLMNFLSLRNHSQAMAEIKQYAEVVESIFGFYMPITAESFRGNGRIAP